MINVMSEQISGRHTGRRRYEHQSDTDLVATGAQMQRRVRSLAKQKAAAAGIPLGQYLETIIINDPVDASGVPLWALEERKRGEDSPSLDFETE